MKFLVSGSSDSSFKTFIKFLNKLEIDKKKSKFKEIKVLIENLM